MFKQAISQTALSTNMADSFFNNITGDSFCCNYSNDSTFLSTLRALVYPRMSTEDKISLHFSHSRYSKTTLDRLSETDALNEILGYIVLSLSSDSEGYICIPM